MRWLAYVEVCEEEQERTMENVVVDDKEHPLPKMATTVITMFGPNDKRLQS